jgi:predicted nucleotidyltransferase
LVEDKVIRKKFDIALERFVDRIKADPNVLAIFVLGSYVHGVVWENSDLDVVIVTSDESKPTRSFLVIEEKGVSIQANFVTRSDYRRSYQSYVQGGIMHHFYSTAELLYSAERGISEFNRDKFKVAGRDRDITVLLRSEILIGCHHKAQKTLFFENDIDKAFNWLLLACQELARTLILKNGNIPGRDVITQARELHNDSILEEIFSSTFQTGYNESNLRKSINLIEKYLVDNKDYLFKALFDYMKEKVGERNLSEIDEFFRKAFGNISFFTLVETVEWLANKGEIMKGVNPKRITTKSRVTVDETTVFYIGGDSL